jgi:cation transporter-like permease
MGKKIICASCIAFVVALLVNVPAVFVWNLFLNGQGSINLTASLAVAVSVALSVALAFSFVLVARRRQEHQVN